MPGSALLAVGNWPTRTALRRGIKSRDMSSERYWQRFLDVLGGDLFQPVEVGDGPGHLQNLEVAAGATGT